MATFNALSFIRSNATEKARTRVRGDGFTVTLKGMPSTYTAVGLEKLAASHGKGEVKITTPAIKVGSELQAGSSDSWDGKDAAKLLRKVAGNEAAEGETTSAA